MGQFDSLDESSILMRKIVFFHIKSEKLKEKMSFSKFAIWLLNVGIFGES